MKTNWFAAHKHSISGKPTTATAGHSHELDEVTAAIAELDARLDALEGAAPPPVEPPPVEPPAPPVIGIPVPGSIDATGASDAAASLLTFLASVPDGSTIVFKAGATYRLDSALRLIGRRNLTFEGNGATLRATGTTGAPRTSPFLLENCTGITVRNFTLLGNNPDAGTSNSHHLDRQNQGGVMVYGGGNVLVEKCTIRDLWGDGVYVGANAGIWADGVTFRDSVCERNGRMGVALTAAKNVLVERVRFDAMALFILDIEPDSAAGGATNVTFRDNTTGTYGLSPLFTNYFFAADGAAGSTVRDVTVTRNTVTGGTLKTTVEVARRQNITFTDNVSTVAARGPVLSFAYVDGVTVKGNTQPLTSGALASFTDCTGVVTS